MKWSEDTEHFRKELTEGFAWQSLPAIFLKLHGFKVEMPAMEFRETIQEADRFLKQRT